MIGLGSDKNAFHLPASFSNVDASDVMTSEYQLHSRHLDSFQTKSGIWITAFRPLTVIDSDNVIAHVVTCIIPAYCSSALFVDAIIIMLDNKYLSAIDLLKLHI